ncbi:MAG TPA: competence/damage-inducible protein A [Saprospiraceae bacterium]|nr:competence/damage-inducible protein A [Saprospiraceae bacterium]
MLAAILTIGDEILIGQVVDTNSAWLGQHLSEIGVTVKKSWSVADTHEDITLGLKQALAEADIVFMTGGLGPTKDDMTKKAIADFLGVEMFFHQDTYDRIKRIFDRMGRAMSAAHDDQCLMPVGTQILTNSMGTAPGMLFRHEGKMIISMPGVPYEMKAIMTEEVLPMLIAQVDTTIVHKTILTTGVGETTIENELSDIISTFPSFLKIAYLPSLAQVRLRLSATGIDKTQLNNTVEAFANQIIEKLGDIIYGYGDSSLEKEIALLCHEKKINLGMAESCTGGHIASKIVSIPGSSAFFSGGFVSYSYESKVNLLHVNPATLTTYGAVSEETVKEMVNGTIDALKVDVALSVSGIAGPDGGTPDKPVGTIWICVGNKENKVTYLLKAGKDRSKNIEIASIYALNLLRKFILAQ